MGKHFWESASASTDYTYRKFNAEGDLSIRTTSAAAFSKPLHPAPNHHPPTHAATKTVHWSTHALSDGGERGERASERAVMASSRAADDPEGALDGEEAAAVCTLLIQTTGSPDPHHLTVGHMV